MSLFGYNVRIEERHVNVTQMGFHLRDLSDSYGIDIADYPDYQRHVKTYHCYTGRTSEYLPHAEGLHLIWKHCFRQRAAT